MSKKGKCYTCINIQGMFSKLGSIALFFVGDIAYIRGFINKWQKSRSLSKILVRD